MLEPVSPHRRQLPPRALGAVGTMLLARRDVVAPASRVRARASAGTGRTPRFLVASLRPREAVSRPLRAGRATGAGSLERGSGGQPSATPSLGKARGASRQAGRDESRSTESEFSCRSEDDGPGSGCVPARGTAGFSPTRAPERNTGSVEAAHHVRIRCAGAGSGPSPGVRPPLGRRTISLLEGRCASGRTLRSRSRPKRLRGPQHPRPEPAGRSGAAGWASVPRARRPRNRFLERTGSSGDVDPAPRPARARKRTRTPDRPGATAPRLGSPGPSLRRPGPGRLPPVGREPADRGAPNGAAPHRSALEGQRARRRELAAGPDRWLGRTRVEARERSRPKRSAVAGDRNGRARRRRPPRAGDRPGTRPRETPLRPLALFAPSMREPMTSGPGSPRAASFASSMRGGDRAARVFGDHGQGRGSRRRGRAHTGPPVPRPGWLESLRPRGDSVGNTAPTGPPCAAGHGPKPGRARARFEQGGPGLRRTDRLRPLPVRCARAELATRPPLSIVASAMLDDHGPEAIPRLRGPAGAAVGGTVRRDRGRGIAGIRRSRQRTSALEPTAPILRSRTSAPRFAEISFRPVRYGREPVCRRTVPKAAGKLLEPGARGEPRFRSTRAREVRHRRKGGGGRPDIPRPLVLPGTRGRQARRLAGVEGSPRPIASRRHLRL